MEHFGKKVKLDGYKFPSEKEAQFYQQFIKPSGLHYDVHRQFELVGKFPLGGYNQKGVTYTPDFVVYDSDGKIIHVYDVKTSLSNFGIDGAAKLRFKWFQYRYRKPVEIVVPRAHDFKMTLYGFGTKSMLDPHTTKDIHGLTKRYKNGEPKLDRYNVYRDIKYNVHEFVGW